MEVRIRQISCVYKDTNDVRLNKLCDIKIKMALTENKNLIQAMELVESYLCDGKPVTGYRIRSLSCGATGEEKEAFETLIDLVRE